MHHPTDRITHTTAFITPVVEHWLEREITMSERSTSELRTYMSNALRPFLSFLPISGKGTMAMSVRNQDDAESIVVHYEVKRSDKGGWYIIPNQRFLNLTRLVEYYRGWSGSLKGYCFRLAARVLLYAPSHRQDNTYHGLCYTSRGALAGTRNSSMDPTTHCTMSSI